MAKQIKVLKCPQCGNTKPTSIGKEHYRCDKCKTEFFLDSDDVNININHRVDHSSDTPTININKGLIVVIALVIALVLIAYPTLKDFTSRAFTETTSPASPPVPASRTETAKYLFRMPIAINGEVVSLSIERKRMSDSIYVMFRNIKTGNVLKAQALTHKKEIGTIAHRRFISDASDYIIIDKKRLFKINPLNYTAKDYAVEICAKKPALEAGISKVNFISEVYGEGFILQTNLGKKLYYYPSPDILCTENAVHYIMADKPMKNATPMTYYLFRNKESAHSSNVAELLEIRYTFNAGGPENKLTEATDAKLKNSAAHRILSYKPITKEMACFSPKVLYSDNSHVLISYLPSLAKDAKMNLRLIDTKGEAIWTKEFAEVADIKYTVRGTNEFVLLTDNGRFVSVSEDGKTEHTYKMP